MDAWEILADNSTLESGDAWEHLNNQQGEGIGGDITVIIGGDAQADVDMRTTAECAYTEATANVDEALSANVLTITLEAEVSS